MPKNLRQYSNRKLFIVLGSVIAVTFIASAATLFAISSLLVFRQGAQTHNDARMQLQMLLTDLSDAETGQRGYLLTGDPSYLQPYDNAVKVIPGRLTVITTATTGTAPRADIEKLSLLVTQKLAELTSTVQMRQSGDATAAQQILLSGVGQSLMEQTRALARQVESDEIKQLDSDRASVTNLSNLVRDISVVALIAILVLVVGVYWLYLKAIQDERRLDAAKDEFVALASHQLRTPATGIKSILATLVDEDFGPLNEKQKYFMNRALESNERELAIIEELLNVAKADAGRLILHTTEFELGNLVASIASEQRPAIAKKDQDLVIKQPSRPVRIIADEEKLYMAIGNLLDNARKYTPEAGKISIDVSTHRGVARIEVADTGTGIDQTEIDHIFDRFHRANDSLAGSVDGAGLGLYLAGRIAQLHDGTIEVTSKLGKGTKFVMILPQGDRNAAKGFASRG